MPTRPVAHPIRTPTTPEETSHRQAGEAASDARAEALIPMVTDAIEMPSAATQMPGNRPRPGAAPQRSAISGMRSYTGNPEPDASRRDARSSSPGAREPTPPLTAQRTNPGTRRHARTCRCECVSLFQNVLCMIWRPTYPYVG
jgi:hypothetical protein